MTAQLCLLAFALVVVPMTLGCAAKEPPPRAPCDTETLTTLTAQCAVDAAHCVQEGGTEERCGAICDERLDARAEQCR